MAAHSSSMLTPWRRHMSFLCRSTRESPAPLATYGFSCAARTHAHPSTNARPRVGCGMWGEGAHGEVLHPLGQPVLGQPIDHEITCARARVTPAAVLGHQRCGAGRAHRTARPCQTSWRPSPCSSSCYPTCSRTPHPACGSRAGAAAPSSRRRCASERAAARLGLRVRAASRPTATWHSRSRSRHPGPAPRGRSESLGAAIIPAHRQRARAQRR